MIDGHTHLQHRLEPPWILIGALSSVVLVCGVYGCGMAEAPTWCQPSLLGCAWGLAFFAGVLLASTLHGSSVGAVVAGVAVAAAIGTTRGQSDLNLSWSTLLICNLCSAGWVVGRWKVAPRLAAWSDGHPRRSSMFDILVWTTILATMLAAGSGWGQSRGESAQSFTNPSVRNGASISAAATPGIQPAGSAGHGALAWHMFMLVAVTAAMAGTVCCWAAVHAVFSPDVSVSAFVAALILGIMTSVCLPLFLDDTVDLASILRWAAAGPVQAIAAQSATVLALAALLRHQRPYLMSDRGESQSTPAWWDIPAVSDSTL
ncbi:MAG: hypothetical protein D6753_13630 [Planctomycetota bacterium]|nr:MAG: hypothetical protein D6753_13630 [Planctomycetota bacterium]